MTWTLQLPLAYGLAWALVHFLWLGALIALLLAAALPLVRAAQTRYVSACAAMAGMAAAFVSAWAWSIPQVIAPQTPQASDVASTGLIAQPAGAITGPE